MKKAVVLFPGVRYGCDAPLLYFARTAFRQRGFDVFELEYGKEMQTASNLEAKIQDTMPKVLKQLQNMGLDAYEDVVFVSKSIGTVLAGWSALHLCLPSPIRHIFLTPLEQTLPFINGKRDVVIGAGKDEYLSANILTRYCEEREIPVTIYPDVGHRLEDKESSRRTLAILQEIIEVYERF